MYPLPMNALAQHIAALGKTGSGKTSTCKLIVEQVVGSGFRVCVLDPVKSDWWGITSSADGKSEGLPFTILGGPRGHVALSPSSGHAIAELVASGDLPLSILDLADFGPGQHTRFFCDFAETLMRKMTGVLYLVLEEAHEFAPKERAGVGQENMALYWAKKLATAGRSKGIRLILATQRTQSLHNALLGSCETMIVHRLTAPADQKPVKDWLAANAPRNRKSEVESSLSNLKTGSAWICSGELALFELTRFPRIQTFDNSATPTKDSKRIEVKRASVDVDKIRELIGEAVEEAEANDPELLRKRIRELELELKGADKAMAAAAASGADELDDALARGEEVRQLRERIEWLEHNVRIRNDELNDRRDKFRTYLEALREAMLSLNRLFAMLELSAQTPDAGDPAFLPSSSTASVPRETRPQAAQERPERSRAAPAPSAGGKLPKAERAILRALYWLRDESVTPEKTAFLSGYSATSSSSANALSALRRKGLVAGWRPTAQGIAAIAAVAGEKPTGPELRDWLRPRLSRAENMILDVLAFAKGKPQSAEMIAKGAGYSRTSSSFANAISKLRSIGAAVGYEKDGGTRIADELL